MAPADLLLRARMPEVRIGGGEGVGNKTEARLDAKKQVLACNLGLADDLLPGLAACVRQTLCVDGRSREPLVHALQRLHRGQKHKRAGQRTRNELIADLRLV